jgi:hypothetical protein
MAGETPKVRALSYAPDLGLMDGNAGFIISEEFDDAGAFRRYLARTRLTSA